MAAGDYDGGIRVASQALALSRSSGDWSGQARALNTIGGARIYQADYEGALGSFQQSLDLYHRHGQAEREIILLNNIGNVYYFQGRYQEALHWYRRAERGVTETAAEPWNGHVRQFTTANLASLMQRLGRYETALALYRSLGDGAQKLSANEKGRVLANQGALYRRLGDPVKAMECYREAQKLFERERLRDAEISALRNMGVALALDFHDVRGAEAAFRRVLALSAKSGSRWEEMLAYVYLGELHWREENLIAARTEFGDALAAARDLKAAEEEWKALYGLGRVAREEGDTPGAAHLFGEAIARIESIREGLQMASLRPEFLADKRDVYDAAIASALDSRASSSEIFDLIERSRARTLQDRLRSRPTLAEVQARVAAGTILLDYWTDGSQAAILWATHSDSGITRPKIESQVLDQAVDALSQPGSQWRELSRVAGNALLNGLPLRGVRRIVIVPDGELYRLPFEALTSDGGLLVERASVSYLPAASLLGTHRQRPHFWMPWRRSLVVFAAPAAMASDIEAEDRWAELPQSDDEAVAIARLVRGRAEMHIGRDAVPEHLDHVGVVPLLHFATHSVADLEDAGRSRIVLAGGALFPPAIQAKDLGGVDLVTLSSCDTERGRIVLGEGVQSLGRAFLAAGAGATVTSLWRVDDSATAEFMKQFYYFLERNETKGDALTLAKRRLAVAGGDLSHPYYWAAFVLNGDAMAPVPLPLGAGTLLLSFGTLAALSALTIRIRARGSRAQKASLSPTSDLLAGR